MINNLLILTSTLVLVVTAEYTLIIGYITFLNGRKVPVAVSPKTRQTGKKNKIKS